jgi:hypothetical protein
MHRRLSGVGGISHTDLVYGDEKPPGWVVETMVMVGRDGWGQVFFQPSSVGLLLG